MVGRWLWVAAWVAASTAGPLPHEMDSEQTRKLLGESVVTSVSVIMDHGNGTKTYLTDAQEQDRKPQVVGTPGTLLAPDRYEFYTFGEDGELVKKLMSLDQIQSLIAGGSEADELEPLPVYYPQPDSSAQNEGVTKVLQTVQNLLKGELQAAKVQHRLPAVPMPDHSWSILLPGLINSELDFKDPGLPMKNEPTPLPSISNHIQTSKTPTTTSQRRPPTMSTTTKYTTPSRPTSQTTVFQKIATPSTTFVPVSTTTRKPSTESKLTNNHITPAPFTKTTGHLVTKPQSQRPFSTTKKPFISTKKPYVSDSPYAKIPLINTMKPETTSKISTIAKKPVMTEERNPSTKAPEIKKPIPDKQKPSGIPTITHYLPISSSSTPSNSSTKTTTIGQQETTTMKQTIKTTVTKEPVRITTTKRPTTKPTSHQSTPQKHAQTTRKPVKPTQGKPAALTQNKTTSQKITANKVVQKTPKPTTSPQTTKTQTKVTSVHHTTTPTTVKSKPDMTIATVKPITSTTYQLVNTSMKHTTIPHPQKLTQTKKPQTVIKPSSNIIAQSSNVVNSKIKPSTVTEPSTVSSPLTTQKSTPTAPTTTTPQPERITTFSYTSKVTSTGEIITSTVPSMTTQQKYVTGAVSSTSMSSTNKVNPTTIKTTEKPLQKVTQAQLESISSLQTTKEQASSPMFHKPTTYHPQNFHSTSKKPAMQSTPSSTTSFQTKSSVTHQPLKISSAGNYISTINPNVSTQRLPSQTSPYPGMITTQVITKPTTEITPEGTTLSLTTLGINMETTQSGHGESSTYSTDDMPLQEIPLKIYESLKDNIAGPQDIMTTIMSENMPTTTGKIESTYTTMNTDETTIGSTVPIVDKTTTITTTTGASTITPQTNKVIETNRPAGEIISTTTKMPAVEQKNEVIDTNSNKDALQESASMPEEQRYNVTKPNNTLIPSESTTLSSTDSINASEPSNSESTTNIDSTTIYKDHILQEGISAVTNILLDEAQRQQAMKEAMLASVMKDDSTKDKIRTTTENELTSTTVINYTEMQNQNNDKDEMKSEVRLNEDAELPEKLTTEKMETTTMNEKPKTTTTMASTTTKAPTTTPTTMKATIKEATNENVNKPPVKKSEQKPLPVLPTKESKLNPDSEPHVELSKIKQDHVHNQPEPSLKLRATATPDAPSTTEKVKLSDYQEKSVPKPLNSFPKKPNPVYQPLESLQPPAAIELHPAPYESMGLEASIAFLSEDVRRFADLCNELAFRMWTSITGKGQISSRSLVMSPFAVTSLLAMVFLGARGPTSGQMNDVLRLDDMVTFNPHQVLQNVTDSVINSKNYGVATAAFVRELYSDKGKGRILDFYKERVQQYYQGHVEEVTFTMIGDIIRRRTNLLVKRQTLGKVPEYLRGSSLNMRPPLAAFSANIFQTDCEQGSTDGRDGEMYFVVRPSTRQRRLVPVPAVVWRSGFLAGYEPSLDATSVCLGAESVVSTILILPGQQGQVAPGDGLARLEQRLIETSYRRGGWSRLLRSLMPRPGLELQIPRFSHRSVLNITGSLQRMGLKDLFNTRADLRGLNGLSNDLHLSDMLQVNTFSTCGEETIGARHHVETYPASPQRMGRDDLEYYPPKDFENTFGDIPLSLRPRQARLPDNPRLRFDRPFLYMVRHNPSGMILHIGRFNPRLLP